MQQNLFDMTNFEKLHKPCAQLQPIVIRRSDKKYRKTTTGRWEYYYPLSNGENWHEVINYNIKHQLDNLHKAL